jgi:hypothetical protein
MSKETTDEEIKEVLRKQYPEFFELTEHLDGAISALKKLNNRLSHEINEEKQDE